MTQEYVLGFAFRGTGTQDKSEVLLIRKARRMHVGLLNGLGGEINPNESPVDAMSREFLEESGYAVTPDRWLSYGDFGGPGFKVYLFAHHMYDGNLHKGTCNDAQEGTSAWYKTKDIVADLHKTAPGTSKFIQAALLALLTKDL